MKNCEHYKVFLDAGTVKLKRVADCPYNYGLSFDKERQEIVHLSSDLYMHWRQLLSEVRATSAKFVEDTETLVIEDIKKRQAVGIKKYDVTVADNPLSLRQWLQHAYEEVLDNAIYLKRAIQEIDQQQEQAQETKQKAKE